MAEHFRRMVHVHRQAPLTDLRRLGEARRAIAKVSLRDCEHWQVVLLAFVARSVLDSISAEKHSKIVHREHFRVAAKDPSPRIVAGQWPILLAGISAALA